MDPLIILIDAPTPDVSSTAIRSRRAENQPIDGLVTPAVEKHIEQHGLVHVGPDREDGEMMRRRTRRQAGCMAKAEARRKPSAFPRQVKAAIKAAEDKKAEHLVVLDLRKAAGFTDFFVICSGTNPRQIRAIADGVMEALAADGAKPAHLEGYDRSEWILLDYFDFVVHVFAPETRTFYGLERLWGNAERVEL